MYTSVYVIVPLICILLKKYIPHVYLFPYEEYNFLETNILERPITITIDSSKQMSRSI